MEKEFIGVKCPSCGARNGFEMSHGWLRCTSCYSQFYVRDEDMSKALSAAHEYLKTYAFDEADALYARLAREAEEMHDMDAYATAEWGRLMAYFGVVYIKSYSGTISVPTFTRYNKHISSVKDVEYYRNIMDADIAEDVKCEYQRMASELDETYSRIAGDLSANCEYDLFICTKISTKTDANMDADGYTRDSRIAGDLYDYLTDKGVKVFYSDKCCRGIEYDATILSALLRSKMMLVIATSKDYIESKWVESEWRRWLSFIKWEDKAKDSLLLYLPDFNGNHFALPSVLINKRVQYYTSDDYIKLIDIITSSAEVNRQYSRHQDRVERVERDVKAHSTLINKSGMVVDFPLLEMEECENEGFDLIEIVDKGDEYYYGTLGERNFVKAVQQYIIASERGSNIAKVRLAHCYIVGNGVDVNIRKAITLYEQVANAGNKHVQYALAELLTEQGNVSKARTYYQQSAWQNYAPAMYKIAINYLLIGNKKDKKEGFELLNKAAEQNYANAEYSIGECYLRGSVVGQNILVAEEWIKRAIAHGSIDNKHFVLGSNGLEYESISATECKVVSYSGEDAYVIIPELHDGKYVTAIAKKAFADDANIISVNASIRMMDIGKKAFMNCERLEIVKCVNATRVGAKAFKGCKALGELRVDVFNHKVGYHAFKDCSNIDIYLPVFHKKGFWKGLFLGFSMRIIKLIKG